MVTERRGRINLTERPRGGRYPPGTHLRDCDDAWGMYARAYRRWMEAGDLSPYTIKMHEQTLLLLARFCDEKGMPNNPVDLTREHVEEFLKDQIAKHRHNTVVQRQAKLIVFFRWLYEEGERPDNALQRMKRMTVKPPVYPPATLDEEQVRRLFQSARGVRGLRWKQRRDEAILRLMIDSGLRIGELVALDIDDLARNGFVVVRRSKSRRQRVVPIGVKASYAINRWLRERDRRLHSDDERALFLDKTGRRYTRTGLEQRIKYFGELAGLFGLTPHTLRHTWAHLWLKNGGSEHDLVTMAGWSPASARQMLERYGAARAVERAKEAHRQFSPGDRI